tara:strand:+ start:2413 stop:2676 length:264 start_codon:yes stop_codon:yes gene_type:complete
MEVEQGTMRAERVSMDENMKEYKPSRSEYLREHEVRIRFLTLGCIIEVGCKSIPFTTVREGMEALIKYVANPHEIRKIWNEKFQKEE